MTDEAPADTAALLAASGGYSAEDLVQTAYARILMLGPPKRGKTTAIMSTIPKDHHIAVLNGDGDSALKYPVAKLGCRNFTGFDINSRKTWQQGIDKVEKLADAGAIQHAMLDSVTLLADNLLDEISARLDGYEIWKEYASQILRGCKRLFALPCHVYVVAHMVNRSDADEGIVPLIAGQAKEKLPGIAHDVVLFDHVANRKPHERMFLLGPQGSWSYSGRNVNRTCAVEATVPALFKELGITL